MLWGRKPPMPPPKEVLWLGREHFCWLSGGHLPARILSKVEGSRFLHCLSNLFFIYLTRTDNDSCWTASSTSLRENPFLLEDTAGPPWSHDKERDICVASFPQDSTYCQNVITMTSYDVQYKSVVLSLFWFSAFCFKTSWASSTQWIFAVCSYRHVISTVSLLNLSQFSVALWRLQVKSCSCWNTEKLCYWPQLGLDFTLWCCQVFDIYMPSSLLESYDCN